MASALTDRPSPPTPGFTGGDRALVVLLLLAFYLPGTFGVSLFDRDEGWYARMTREMVESGDWLVPRLLGEHSFLKPAWMFWWSAASVLLLGWSEFSLRLPCVLFSTAAWWCVADWTAAWWGRRAGWWAAVIAATCLGANVAARLLIADGYLLCFTVIALRCWFCRIAAPCGGLLPAAHGLGEAPPSRALQSSHLFWLAVGLALLIKGPAIAVVLVPLSAALFALPVADAGTDRSWRARLRGAWPGPGWYWAVLIGLPWYALAALRDWDEFRSGFIQFYMIDRVGESIQGHGGPPGYYIAVGLPLLWPWSALIPGLIWLAVRECRKTATVLPPSPLNGEDRGAGAHSPSSLKGERRGEGDDGDNAVACEPFRNALAALGLLDRVRIHLLLCWLIAPWIAFEIIQTKLPHYLLPLLPPMVMLLARAAARLTVAAEARFVLDRWARLLCDACVLIVALACAAAAWFLHPLASWIPAAAIAVLLAMAVAFVRGRVHPWRATLKRTAAAGALFLLIAELWWLPALEPLRLSRRVADAANARAAPGQPVRIAGYREPSVWYYVRNPLAILRPADLLKRSEMGGDFVLIADADRLAEWSRWIEFDAAAGERISGLNYVNLRRVTVWVGEARFRR